MLKFIILEIIGDKVFPILYDYEGPAKVFTEEEAVKELIQLRRDSPHYRYQLVSLQDA